MSEQESKKSSSESPDKTNPIMIGRPRLSAGDNDAIGYVTPTVSPSSEHKFLIPSPMVTRRTRTFSASRRANEGPVYHGVCELFSRSKGHGFIRPKGQNSGERIFMHVSDIDCDYVPLPGDEVSYKLTPLPMKNDQFQAVEVRITGMTVEEGKQHVRWDGAPAPM
uniref:Calcium-regulated heat stable protein 1-like n=1 Tax=Phallusia mammillata TaxID=59560 RepID=A0A6F9D7L1_9ASCI|nr:calcium-regulated heat stable protein 1-like [Phallusia mammillata]